MFLFAYFLFLYHLLEQNLEQQMIAAGNQRVRPSMFCFGEGWWGLRLFLKFKCFCVACGSAFIPNAQSCILARVACHQFANCCCCCCGGGCFSFAVLKLIFLK